MNRKRKEELDGKWKTVATHAVTDDAFKSKLAADPVAVMHEHDIQLPEGVEAKVGTGKIVKLFPPDDASEDILAEVKWWEWRLDMIREFGREEESTEMKYTAPDSEEDDT